MGTGLPRSRTLPTLQLTGVLLLLFALCSYSDMFDAHCHKEKQGFLAALLRTAVFALFWLLKVRDLLHLCKYIGRAEYSVMPQAVMSHSTLVFQHSTAQHSTAQHSTAQHSTAQHSTAQHSTARRIREDACQMPYVGFQHPIAA